MKVVSFKGYAVKFCADTRCGHTDRDVCVNPKFSKFYISEKNAERLSRNIVAGTPVVLSHDSECQVGEIRDSWVTDFGIVVRGYVNDPRLLTALRSQVDKYRKQYSRKMSYEDYVKNVFSSISLSHDPDTLHVNHVGLVNIPGRTGTEIKFDLTQTVPVKRYSCSDNDIRDSISAHLVAFLRNPNRVDKLVWNGRNSYANKIPRYLQASDKPYSEEEEMPSNRESMALDLASQLLEIATNGSRKRYREPADLLDDQIQSKRRREAAEQPPATEEKQPSNEDALVERISKRFETQIASMGEKYDKRFLELEESRSKELSSLTDIIKSVAAPDPPRPATTVTPEPIEAAAGTTRPDITDRYKSRQEDLQALLLNTLRTALLN